MVTIFSLSPGWGERIRDKVASVPEAERERVFQEAVIAEFTGENDRITAALAAATEPSKVEELRLARARLGAEMMLVGEGLLEATNVITADPATVSTRLAALESRWRETGNAAFVWRALELLLNVKKAGAEPLPPWCIEYLSVTARNLARVDQRARGNKGQQRQRFGNLVAAALQLTRRGANAFIAAQREDQRIEVARIAGLIRSSGKSAAHANAEANRVVRVGEKRAQERNVARGKAALKARKPEG
jgi:hypothetical protein